MSSKSEDNFTITIGAITTVAALLTIVLFGLSLRYQSASRPHFTLTPSSFSR